METVIEQDKVRLGALKICMDINENDKNKLVGKEKGSFEQEERLWG